MRILAAILPDAGRVSLDAARVLRRLIEGWVEEQQHLRTAPDARAFLTVSNSHLKFWCRVADVDMHAILRTYGQGGKVARIVGDVEPDEFDDFVKKPLLAVP